MRIVLFLLILVVVALLVAVGTGLVNITQTRPANVPDVDASSNGLSATGGQTPTFDIETGSVAVGTRQTNVTLPTVNVNPANSQQQSNPRQQPPANTAG